MIFWILKLSCLLINYVGLVVGILEIARGIEGVDKRDGDKIFVGVDGIVAEMKLRYVESMFFNRDFRGVVYFAGGFGRFKDWRWSLRKNICSDDASVSRLNVEFLPRTPDELRRQLKARRDFSPPRDNLIPKIVEDYTILIV